MKRIFCPGPADQPKYQGEQLGLILDTLGARLVGTDAVIRHIAVNRDLWGARVPGTIAARHG